MIRENVFSITKQLVTAHDGKGVIQFSRVFKSEDFETNLAFIDYVEIPPGSSIGLHQHGENEEVYFIVEGEGVMTVNQMQSIVTNGELIVNRRGWKHGLENNSDNLLKVLVWEVTYSG